LRPRSLAYKAQLAQELRQHVWPHLDAGRINPIIHSTFVADQAAAAHALMESSAHVGKIVLTW
jgi:NADPH:quinone reductase